MCQTAARVSGKAGQESVLSEGRLKRSALKNYLTRPGMDNTAGENSPCANTRKRKGARLSLDVHFGYSSPGSSTNPESNNGGYVIRDA